MVEIRNATEEEKEKWFKYLDIGRELEIAKFIEILINGLSDKRLTTKNMGYVDKRIKELKEKLCVYLVEFYMG
jgi:hypothetical protein